MRMRSTFTLAATALAAVSLTIAPPAGASTTDEIVLTKVDTTVDSAAVLCNGEPTDAGSSTAIYQVTLEDLTRAQLAGLRDSLRSPSDTSGIHMGWQHYIDEMGDATAEIFTTMTVSINGRNVGRERRFDSGEQNTEFVFTPVVRAPSLMRNGDVITIEVTSLATAECNSGTGTFHQAIAQASTATFDGHTAHIDYSY